MRNQMAPANYDDVVTRAVEAIAAFTPGRDQEVPVDGQPFTYRVARLIVDGLRANPGMAAVVRAALTDTEECPTCGMADSHVVLGHETILDHRWKQP